MADAPQRIWAWVWDLPYPSRAQGVPEWNASIYPFEQSVTEYRRADLPPTLAEAMTVVVAWPGLRETIEKGMIGHRQGAFLDEYVSGVIAALRAASEKE